MNELELKVIEWKLLELVKDDSVETILGKRRLHVRTISRFK